MYSLHVHSKILNEKPLLWPSNSLDIRAITLNKPHKPRVLTELTFWRWARHKPTYHGFSKWKNARKKRKQKMGVTSTSGSEVATLKQMVRDHVNRNLKSRRNSKLKGTKQDYVSWIQSQAMRPGWLEQKGGGEVGSRGRGTRSYRET